LAAKYVPLLEGVYRSSRDRLAATVPADQIEGFRSFALAALARYTVPIMMKTSEHPSISWVPVLRRVGW
jgi:hypothetical protein